ncbi:hypothetical protein J2X42_004269, partial [Arthrobacter sp. BE255]|nr:hypothetical protein [Arthrobacter sp. BE255]
ARGTDIGLLVKVTGTDPALGDTNAANQTTITGPLPALVQWATGRGTTGVTAARDNQVLEQVPVAPKWI